MGEVESNIIRHLWSTCHLYKVLDLSARNLIVKNANEFENALSVSDHIRSAHHEELRKMFAKDARENLEEDSEYQIWLEAPTEIYKNDATNLIKELESANEVLKRRLNEERRDTYKKVGERDGIIEYGKVIYSGDGKTKKGVVKEHFAKVTKRCSD